MSRSWFRVLLVTVIGCGVICAAGGSALAKPPILRLKFHRLLGYMDVSSNGRYVFLNHPGGGTLLDERTGSRREVKRPARGCRAPMLTHKWVVFHCSNSRGALYSLTSRRWTTVKVGGWISAAGANWLEVAVNCSTCASYSRTEYQNLTTGEVRPDPTNEVTLPNIDTPGLTEHVCDPVRVPVSTLPRHGQSGFDKVYGSLALAGPFAVATQVEQGPRDSLAYNLFLERCGSNLDQPLCSFCSLQATGKHLALWSSTGNVLHGLRLPSKRQFRVFVPIKQYWSAVLSSRHLYVAGQTGGHAVFESRVP